MSDLRQTVIGEIRAEMGRKQISGNKLALAHGVTQSWVSNRLTGKVALDLDDLEFFASALDVPLSVLLGAGGGDTKSHYLGEPLPVAA